MTLLLTLMLQIALKETLSRLRQERLANPLGEIALISKYAPGGVRSLEHLSKHADKDHLGSVSETGALSRRKIGEISDSDEETNVSERGGIAIITDSDSEASEAEAEQGRKDESDFSKLMTTLNQRLEGARNDAIPEPLHFCCRECALFSAESAPQDTVLC